MLLVLTPALARFSWWGLGMELLRHVFVEVPEERLCLCWFLIAKDSDWDGFTPGAPGMLRSWKKK